MSLFDRDDSARRLPVSVITGFLGSGKTTLLNRLLRDPAMADSAVIVNEFGEIGLDHLLMERIDGETVLMASGCLCCTVRSDLEQTLRDLDWKRRDGTVPPFARVLVETTGLADPAPILQLLLNHPIVCASYRLDAVVATVDALHAMRQLDEHAESVKQVALADRLVLTKTDLAGADDGGLSTRLKAINPAAPVHRAVNGDIAAGLLFGAALYDPARRTPDARAWLRDEAYAPADAAGHGNEAHHHHHAAHAHARDVNRHDARIAAFCLVEDQPIDWDRFHRWLGRLRAERGHDLLRVKGILNLAGEPAPVAIHGVHHVFHPPVQLGQWPDDDRRSRVVFITRDLPGDQIAQSWRDAPA
ncbi:MAG: GTP-binding protein [Alphaproteobacteria bacterium]|nr:GTP-binding protein [Alphaproteobacteria bacterium]